MRELKFQLARYEPTEDLRFFVEHFWLVTWDLREQEPYLSETLPHPSIHLVVEPDVAHIVGVVTTKFSRLLEGQGQAFGIKFNPGAFYPFVQTPVSHYTDKTVGLADAFGTAGTHYEMEVRATAGDAGKVAVAESFLRQLSPAYDKNVTLVNLIVDAISAERTITKVDHLAHRFNINKRGLQRLFHQYIGVSPKWVIQRYRLHEAAERMASGEAVDWSRLAVDLGYFDQAHFIKDFKAIVGLTPAEYAKNAG
ncbi:MAG: AraC family transcriptional regulator [Caldilineaceae bacterium]|nr:AraC family transcriptional regulator [Caldilineaceae bacterium]